MHTPYTGLTNDINQESNYKKGIREHNNLRSHFLNEKY